MEHKLIGRGKSGWHSCGFDRGNKCSSSGGSLEGYLSEAEDGTPIYDADEADFDAFSELVISGPMEDVSLPPGTISSSGDDATLVRMLPGLQDGFATIAKLKLAGYTSLDYVATDVYLGMLAKIPGMKIGKVVGHKVVWNTAP